jgi:hypothetical protein
MGGRKEGCISCDGGGVITDAAITKFDSWDGWDVEEREGKVRHGKERKSLLAKGYIYINSPPVVGSFIHCSIP